MPSRPRFPRKDIRLSAAAPMPPLEAYRLLTSAEGLSRLWGGPVQAQGKNGGILKAPGLGSRRFLKGVFVDLEPGRKVAWLWEKTCLPTGAPALTTIFIEEEAPGSRLTVVHAGFPSTARKAFEAFHRFWRERLERLLELAQAGTPA